MAKNRTASDLQKVDGVAAILQKYSAQDDSLLKLGEYVIVPYVKVIQGMSEQVLKDTFGEGSAILRPGDTLIIKRPEMFKFVPIFFYTLFRKWGDRKDPQMVMESTYDPLNDIAKKSRDPDLWEEVYPDDVTKPEKEQRKFRYVEHLCFIGTLYGESPLFGTLCQISFQKGDFRTGRSFATGIQMRKQQIQTDDGLKNIPIPLWAQVWEFKVTQRDRNGNKWWGFDPCNPSSGDSIIKEEEFPSFNEIYAKLKKAHEASMLRIDGDDSGLSEDETEIATSSKDF